MKPVSRVARTVRDVCLIVMGVLTILDTPASIAYGLTSVLSLVWSLLLVLGGGVCLVGAVCRSPLVECAGCILAAVAFATWAAAAVTQPDTSLTAWVIAVLLISGVAGQAYRVAEVIDEARPVSWPQG